MLPAVRGGAGTLTAGVQLILQLSSNKVMSIAGVLKLVHLVAFVKPDMFRSSDTISACENLKTPGGKNIHKYKIPEGLECICSLEIPLSFI